MSVDPNNPIASMAAHVDTELSSFTDAAGPSGYWSEDARKSISAAQSAIRRATSAASQAVAKSEKIMADQMIYPEGRKMLAGTELDTAEAAAQENLEAADIHVEVAEAVLYLDAVPKVGRTENMTARQDATMILDHLQARGVNVLDAIKRLASRQDAVGALVNTDWIGDYLTAEGHDAKTVKNIKTVIRHQALEAAAAQNLDTDRRNAARAALAMRHMRRAGIAARTTTRHLFTKGRSITR